ncbi:MAG TPA: RNA polymerase sigma factor [Bryobacteraceae bacterium]|jgi:RNA polymerase sigma-70 factor (ECF subfamily)|nr:RNA polymerase sigma factor [Bryobacteraceae bacterium]
MKGGALAFVTMEQTVDGPDSRTHADDLAAFETIMRQYERLVLVTAYRLLGNMEDAKDVSQEAFLRLYRNMGKASAAQNYQAWLYRVTVNLCHDAGRRRKPSVAVEDVPELVSPAAGPQESLAGSERQRILQMSLRALSPTERDAVVLRDLEGLSTEEVARALGSSEATVRSQISKGRVKMRNFVERYFRRRV